MVYNYVHHQRVIVWWRYAQIFERDCGHFSCVLSHSLCEGMATVQERVALVKTYMIFFPLTHTAVQTIDSSNHPVHPVLSLLSLCALHRNMGGLILRAE